MAGQQVNIQLPRMGIAVKCILITCGVMFFLQLSLEQFAGIQLAGTLGFVPALLLKGWIWQPFTYAFLHGGVMHLLFNLLIVWSIGSELENVWGERFFVLYFFACTLGAAVTYALFSALGIGAGPNNPVIGSSGAVYGLLLAYGILFGDRVLYFFMIFPMKARYFVMILGGIVLVSTVFYSDNGVAHTAHLGGMVAGLAIILAVTYWKRRQRSEVADQRDARGRRSRIQKASHLRLVKGEEPTDGEDPDIWH